MSAFDELSQRLYHENDLLNQMKTARGADLDRVMDEWIASVTGTSTVLAAIAEAIQTEVLH